LELLLFYGYQFVDLSFLANDTLEEEPVHTVVEVYI
jgi:hypothetical protein